MTLRFHATAALALVALALTLAVAAFALVLLTWSTPAGDDITPSAPAVGFVIAAATFTVVGAVVALKRPENPIGWLFLIAGVFTAVDIAHSRYLLYTVVESPASFLPSLAWSGALINALWIVPMTATVVVLLTFPEGRTRSRRWTAAAAGVVVCAVVTLLLLLLEPGPMVYPVEDKANPLGVSALEGFTFLMSFSVLGVASVALAGVIALIRRLQRTTGDGHEQLKWFAYVVAWLPPVTVGWVIANILGEAEGAVFAGLSFATTAIVTALPISIGFAVLKYRLYDIDVIVNRTLVYVPLTAVLAGLFAATTGLFRAIFTEVSGAGSDSAVAISTLAVVAFFTPVKNTLQSFVDRRFKEQLDPSAPLKAMAKEARTILNVLDTRRLMQEFVDKATTALDAEGSALFLAGYEAPVLTSGDPDATAVLSFPLLVDESQVGELSIGPSHSRRAYNADQVQALAAETDVLARALLIYRASTEHQKKHPSHLLDSSDVVMSSAPAE